MSLPIAAAEQTSASERTRWFADEVHAHDSQLKSYLRGSFPAVRGDVDDVVQESYLRIWKARATQPIKSAKAFLFQVARRLALDFVRRQRRSPIESMSDFHASGVIEDKPDAAEAAGLQERIDLLADAIAALPARRREIVILRKLKRVPQKDVAAQLGLAERTVENQLHRGVRQCEAYLRARGVRSLYGHEK